VACIVKQHYSAGQSCALLVCQLSMPFDGFPPYSSLSWPAPPAFVPALAAAAGLSASHHRLCITHCG